MKKYFLFFVIFVTSLLIPSDIFADDGGPNTVFWIKSDKVVCISVNNPEDIPQGKILVYDYSSKIGEKMGKPWADVQKGKCYEYDQGVLTDSEKAKLKSSYNRGEIFLVEKIFYDQIKDYIKYKPTEDLTQISDQKPIWYVGYKGVLTASDIDYVTFTGISSNDVFPTKYELGETVTSFSSDYSEFKQKMLNDHDFNKVSSLYQDLAGQFEEKIRFCDNRVRIEFQLYFTNTDSKYDLIDKNTIWKFKDRDVFYDESNQYWDIFSSQYDPFPIIDLIGCKSSYIEFIDSHKADFQKIDTLSAKLINKYSDTLSYDYDGITRYVFPRNDDLISKINDYINSRSIKPTPTTTKTKEYLQTSLDQPTTEKKTEIVRNSENPFVKIYFLLPFLSLSVILLILLNKNILLRSPRFARDDKLQDKK